MNNLNRKLTRRVLAERNHSREAKDNTPRFSEVDRVLCADGKVRDRKKIILMSDGCSVPTCTMCPFTNLNNYKNTSAIDKAHIVSQVKTSINSEERFNAIAIYNDGSFFSDKEIPESIRNEIAEVVSEAGVELLIVESLPQFITKRKLQHFLRSLGSVNLEVGLGLQSSNDFVREQCINTSFSRRTFETTISVLKELQVTPKIYLMQKPPFLTDEEGIYDVISSLNYLTQIGVNNATICPTRISSGSVAMDLYRNNLFTPPNLWAVYDALKRKPSDINTRVACVNLKGTDFESVFPDSCEECNDKLIEEFEYFSIKQSFSNTDLSCNCRDNYTPKLIDENEVKSRIEYYLNTTTRVS